jgi:hypothetical protein
LGGFAKVDNRFERVCCLLVLNSVTSTPQWIRQPEAAWDMKNGYKGGVRVGFIYIKDMYNNDVGKGGVCDHEAYEAK